MEKLLGEETVKRLLVSLKSPKKWRIMDPIEIAKNLKILCDHFPRDEVARRFGINEKGTLWVYLRLLELSSNVQQLVSARKIGMDVAYRISILRDYREQETLAEAVLKYRLNSNEVKGIVQALKKRNPNMPIEECITLALKARPSIQEEHMIVTRIETDTLATLKKESEEKGRASEELIKESLSNALSLTSLKSLKLVNTLVFFSLNKEDFKKLKSKAQEMKIAPENLINVLVRKR